MWEWKILKIIFVVFLSFLGLFVFIVIFSILTYYSDGLFTSTNNILYEHRARETHITNYHTYEG